MENKEKLAAMTDELYDAVKHCLRRGDSFTKYSPTQFLILLVGTNQENCSMIFDRISRYFAREHKSWEQYPVDTTIEENADGSVTVWVNEMERMFHQKGYEENQLSFRLQSKKKFK